MPSGRETAGKPAARAAAARGVDKARRRPRPKSGGALLAPNPAVEDRQAAPRQHCAAAPTDVSLVAAAAGTADDSAPPEDYSAPLWPLHGEPPARCQPASLDAVEPRVLLRTSRFVVVEKPPDVRHDGEHCAVTVETLGRRWVSDAEIKWAHRLDYGTSGLLVGALDKKSAALLGRAFEARRVSKTYLAVTCGAVFPDDFVVDAPIGKFAPGDFRMAVGAGAVKPKAASTRVEVLARCVYEGIIVTKVRLTPLTGRRHQLRVHMRHVGHALVGETTYDSSPLARAPRLCLHAAHLRATLDDGTALHASTGDPFPVAADGSLRILLETPWAAAAAAEAPLVLPP